MLWLTDEKASVERSQGDRNAEMSGQLRVRFYKLFTCLSYLDYMRYSTQRHAKQVPTLQRNLELTTFHHCILRRAYQSNFSKRHRDCIITFNLSWGGYSSFWRCSEAAKNSFRGWQSRQSTWSFLKLGGGVSNSGAHYSHHRPDRPVSLREEGLQRRWVGWWGGEGRGWNTAEVGRGAWGLVEEGRGGV